MEPGDATFVLRRSEAGTAVRVDANVATYDEVPEFFAAVREGDVSVEARRIPWAGPYEIIMTIVSTGADLGGFGATVWALVEAGRKVKKRIRVETDDGDVVLDPDRQPSQEEIERVLKFLQDNSQESAAEVAERRYPGGSLPQ